MCYANCFLTSKLKSGQKSDFATLIPNDAITFSALNTLAAVHCKNVQSVERNCIIGHLRIKYLRCIYTSEYFPQNGKFSADRMRSTIFSKEKIVLRMRSAENFPFRGKFSEVYIHLKEHISYNRLPFLWTFHNKSLKNGIELTVCNLSSEYRYFS